MRPPLKWLLLLVAVTVPTMIGSPYGGELPSAWAQTQPDPSRQAEADQLLQQGLQQYTDSQFNEALQSWQAALAIYRAIGDRANEAQTLFGLGLVNSLLENYSTALECYEQSLAFYWANGDRANEAKTLTAIGLMNGLRANYPTALEYFNQSLVISRELGDRATEATILDSIGEVNGLLRNYPAALDYYAQSLVINRELGDRISEALTLNNIGEVNRLLGNYPRALEYYEQGLVISHELDNRAGEAETLNNIGIVNTSLGNYLTALEYYGQSLVISREFGNRTGEAKTLNNIGNVNNLLGNYPTALEYYEQGLVISRELDNRAGEAATLNNIGGVNRLLGNYLRALEYYEQSLVITRELGDRAGEADILHNIGNVNNLLGNYPTALEYYGQSLVINREFGNRAGEAQTLNNIGNVNTSLGNYPTALEYYGQSIVITREIGDLAGEAITFTNIGNVNQLLGNYPRALEDYEQSLVITRELGNRDTEAQTLNNTGRVIHSQGNYPTAIDYYQQSLVISREIGDRDNEAMALTNIGLAYLNLNNLLAAETALWEAIPLLEDLRDSALPDADKVRLFDLQASTYKLLEQALVLQGKNEAALEVAERGRSRAFAELLSERLSLQQTDSLLVEPPNLAAVQQIAQQNQSVLVEYSLIDDSLESPAIYIWVVQPNGRLDFRQVSLDDEALDLSSLVAGSREAIGVRQRGGFELAANQPVEADQLRQLHQLLIEPIADLLPSNPEQRVVFIPQGDLFLVPFPALMDDAGTYLIEKHTILTAPSIQVLDLSQQQRQTQNFATALTGQDLLLVGNPTMPDVWNPATSKMQTLSNLPGAELEAEEIAIFFNTTPLLGRNATETAVKERIGNTRMVHLATHGLLEYGNPQDSGVSDVPGAIALAPGGGEDGLLTSAEILTELDLNAELVVLSACDTGLGQITGDGVIGLSRALITAGTPSVIVSLWSVPDAPTAELMTEFYSQMQQGQDKAQSLRQAMLATMQTNPDPRDWAAFTLIGAAE
ncbi:MAG: Fis family transcriptional regulator [Leptolyngbya sp.]|nr:MAG: Fis family transcriptional regulator [Leptolyngbya sp.]